MMLKLGRDRIGGKCALAGVAAAVVLGMLMLAAPSALASCPSTSTCFAYTGAEQTYVVPAGATAVDVTAIGAAGGAGCIGTFGTQPDGTGGEGAQISGAVPVTGGETLYVEVGGDGSPPALCIGDVGVGGFNGGANGGDSGSAPGGSGGGGASDVRSVSCGSPCNPLAPTSLSSRLLVAGGGGGSGAEASDSSFGVGGNADTGTGGSSAGGAAGGAPGTQSAGGKGAAPATAAGCGDPIDSTTDGVGGTDGSSGQGGTGGGSFSNYWGAGGGGGGWYGGGGGSSDDSSGDCEGGGGGGGGASHASASSTMVSGPSAATAPASVQITPLFATALAYTGPTSGDYRDPVTLSATLNEAADANKTGLAGEQVNFKVGGESCHGITDATGVASCQVTPFDSPAGGPYPITVSFGGDNNFLASSDTGKSFTVAKEDTALSYTGPQSVAYGDVVTLSGELTDATDHTALPGKTVTFHVGSDACGATTDSTGAASCQVMLLDLPSGGPYQVSASFAGEPDYQAAGDSQPFTIALRPTTLHYTGLTSGAYGQPVTVSGRLKDAETGNGIVGEQVSFRLGSESCQGTTDQNGLAYCSVVPLDSPSARPYAITVHFDGDLIDAPATDASKHFTVTGGPSGSATVRPNLRITHIGVRPLQRGCLTETGNGERKRDAITTTACSQLRLSIRGSIIGAATGEVRIQVTVKIDGRQVVDTVYARIHNGHYRASLKLPGASLDPNAPRYLVTVSYGGASGIRSGSAHRRMRIELEAKH
jgi:hypothetical protein